MLLPPDETELIVAADEVRIEDVWPMLVAELRTELGELTLIDETRVTVDER